MGVVSKLHTIYQYKPASTTWTLIDTYFLLLRDLSKILFPKALATALPTKCIVAFESYSCITTSRSRDLSVRAPSRNRNLVLMKSLEYLKHKLVSLPESGGLVQGRELVFM